jgi:hypothetical protein
MAQRESQLVAEGLASQYRLSKTFQPLSSRRLALTCCPDTALWPALYPPAASSPERFRRDDDSGDDSQRPRSKDPLFGRK